MSDKVIGLAILWLESYPAFGMRNDASPFSELAATLAPVKEAAPSPPEILSATGLTESPGQVRLRLKLPATNVDGTPLSTAELIRIRVHYNTHPNISENDPYNDFPVSETLEFAPNLLGTVYFRAKVMDSHMRWSSLSNEKSCTSTRAAQPFWAHRLGINSIFTNNSPNPGYVSWSNVTLFFKDQEYAIQNGSTNKRYVYWLASNPTVFQTSDTVPALTVNDVLIGTNVDGQWHLTVYYPQVTAEFIRVGKLQSRNWSTSAGSQLDLDSGTLYLGGSSSPKLSWDGSTLRVLGTIQAGSNVAGSNVIALDSSGINVGSAGSIRGGKTGYGSGTGFFLGYADGAYKLDVGSSSQYLRWDGSSLSVSGVITVLSGSSGVMSLLSGSALGGANVITIDGSGINVGTAGSIRGGKTGYGSGTGFFLGYSGGYYRLDVGSDTQFVRWDGSSLTVAGTISVLPNSYLGSSSAITIDSSGINVGTTGSIRGGKTGYGSGTGFFLGYSGGAYKLDIGSSSRYLRWDGSDLYVSGRVYSQSGSNISGNHITSGQITGIPIYGAGAYPYSYLYGQEVTAFQSSSYYGRLATSYLEIRHSQGIVNLSPTQLSWTMCSVNPLMISAETGICVAGYQGYTAELRAYNGTVYLNAGTYGKIRFSTTAIEFDSGQVETASGGATWALRIKIGGSYYKILLQAG